MTLEELQGEHFVWVSSMYPNQPAWLPAAGMVEEAGELLHTVIKVHQCRTWGPEARYVNTDWYAEMVDAIGDCAIYVCSLCNAKGWILSSADSDRVNISGCTLLQLAIDLLRTAADNVTEPLILRTSRYLALLKGICHIAEIDFMQAVTHTWAEVKGRNR